MRRSLTFLTIVLTSAVPSACSLPGSTGPEDVAGSYLLQTINGADLPFPILEVGEDKTEISGGSVKLNEDESYIISFTFRETTGGSATTQTTSGGGIYAVDGSTVQFGDPGDGRGAFAGSLAGNVLTIIDAGFTFLYENGASE